MTDPLSPENRGASTSVETARVTDPSVSSAPLSTQDRDDVAAMESFLAQSQRTAAEGARPAVAPPALPGYEILGEIGRGGQGVVYKARHGALNRLVALKMILSGGHADADELARFRREAEAVARLQHPHIVQVFEVGEHGGLPYIALEFCPGGGLDRKLDGTPLPAKEAAALAATLARAVQAAHEKGVIHRDLKPANILLAEGGTPKITDFGLAKRLDEAGRTATGAVRGTPSYMPPEQAGGSPRQVGPPTDVYALGAILYECLTGRPPFKGPTVLDTLKQVLIEDPLPPRRLQPQTPRDLETICLKCLEKQPGRRYATAADLAEDLRRFQAGEPVRARPVGPLGRAWRWARRHKAVAALIAVAAAVLIIGAGVSTYFAVQAHSALAAQRTALVAQQKAEERYRRAARHFVAFLRRNPDLLSLPDDQLLQRFLDDNTEFTTEDLKGAFSRNPEPAATPALEVSGTPGEAATSAAAPNILGD